MMRTANLAILQQRIAYTFNDESLLTLALTHCSYSSKNNERLEFLGDALLEVTISEQLYHQFPDVKEGTLSHQRSQLVKGITLAEIAREFSLGDYLILGQGELKSGGAHRSSILADALEAIIGAIFLDSHIDQCRQCILRWFALRLQVLHVNDRLKDPKTRLQELLQSKKQPLPIYQVMHVAGEPHAQTFTVNCHVDLLKKPVQAAASSRQEAEKQAAILALNLLNSDQS